MERAEVMQVVTSRWQKSGGEVIEPREATDDDLVRVHDAAYLESIRATRGRAAMLDADTYTSPDSEEIARLGAGAALAAVDYVLDHQNARAMAMVRPPGHHAERDRAMGFCLYNNIAVAAAWARHRGVERVTIVDYDVHHGNGTQSAFYDDPSVLFISSHQFPYYPGTGAADEIGRERGAGFTVNLPVEAGATDDDYDLLFTQVVLPVLTEFRPELLLVSAGFDAHERDPLGGMRVSTNGYAQLTSHLITAADQLCDGRIAFVTEGGYDTSALAECLQGVIDLASGHAPAPTKTQTVETDRAQATIEQVRAAQREHWRSLR